MSNEEKRTEPRAMPADAQVPVEAQVPETQVPVDVRAPAETEAGPATQPLPLPVPIAPLAPAPVAFAAPPSGAPYRAPGDPGPFPAPLFARPQGRPILGPALGVFGVLLWAFVVVGQLTTSLSMGTPLPQAVAVLAVFAATVAALVLATARGRRAVAPRTPAHLFGRVVGTTLLAWLFFVSAVIVATIAGNVGSGHDLLIAFVLVTVAVGAILGGARLTAHGATPPTAPSADGRRVVRVIAWIASALVTFVAGVDLALHG